MDDLFQCLLSQTFEEFECILIDDGSTDASGEICDKVACIDKRFEVIHIPNSGVSHARNVGIDALVENILHLLMQMTAYQITIWKICMKLLLRAV